MAFIVATKEMVQDAVVARSTIQGRRKRKGRSRKQKSSDEGAPLERRGEMVGMPCMGVEKV
ncbi:hypothetical protein CDL15_Pgr012761 [Punica granatum]|uniref:Uncharacterized protein n=1 Tax=Punica granatum TaxID=22663 RepID=A0A218XEW0_PUNGR|nr:hypothetical protein CDL15_Pgr012761 [Punica granatum]